MQKFGAEEDRTPDLRIANATLSQLSYRPMTSVYLANSDDLILTDFLLDTSFSGITPHSLQLDKQIGNFPWIQSILWLIWGFEDMPEFS